MPVLLISYDLKNKFKDYTPLYEGIKKNSNQWWHYLEKTWIVGTNLTSDQFAKKLYPFIENTDFILVVKIEKDYQGWLPKDAWDWLNERSYW